LSEFLRKAAVYHANIEQIGSQGRGFCASALNVAECALSNCCIDLDAFNKEIVMNLKRMLSCVALLLAAAVAVPAGAQTGTGTGGTGGTGGAAGGSAGGATGGTMGGGSPAASSGGATSSAGDTGTTKKKSKKMRGKATRPANGGAGSGNPQ
jgi:hypothetical protein